MFLFFETLEYREQNPKGGCPEVPERRVGLHVEANDARKRVHRGAAGLLTVKFES
jgi:hypothetical protein